jgi:hypothetical protein
MDPTSNSTEQSPQAKLYLTGRSPKVVCGASEVVFVWSFKKIIKQIHIVSTGKRKEEEYLNRKSRKREDNTKGKLKR